MAGKVAPGADRSESTAQRSRGAADENGRGFAVRDVRPVARERRDPAARCDRPGQKAVGSTPPAIAAHHRMARRPPGRELGDQAGKRGATRLGCAHIVRSRLVVAAALGQQRVPVKRAEQRPRRHRADVGTPGASGFRSAPDLEQPTELVLAAGIDVGLGHRQRDAVALPRFVEQRGDRRRWRRQNADRLDIDEILSSRFAGASAGIAIQPMVQPALARHVVVDADHVGRAGMRDEPQDLVGVGAVFAQVRPERMLLVDSAAKQIPGEPAPLVVEIDDMASGSVP